jgi:hypothetical protein
MGGPRFTLAEALAAAAFWIAVAAVGFWLLF